MGYENQTFDTPADALAHYGVKGMRWGVHKKEDRTGRKSAKLDDISTAQISAAIETSNRKTNKKTEQDEAYKKFLAQAEQSFPSKRQERRDGRAARLDDRRAKVDANVESLKAEQKALGKGIRNSYRRANLEVDIQKLEKVSDQIAKDAANVRLGKLTSSQKKMLAIGATAAIAGLYVYGNRQANLKAAGLSGKDAQKELFERNKRESTDQWQQMFGQDPGFTAAGSQYSAMKGVFYSGLTNQKALDRPEFVIPKDTIFQRLSNHAEDSTNYGSVRGAYATFLSNDKKLYGASHEFGNKSFTVNFTAKNDVRVPTVKTTLAHLKIALAEHEPGENHTTDSLYSYYKQLSGGGWNSPLTKTMFDSLKMHGYSAIVDDMDAGYLGDLPIVFFGDANPATSTPRASTQSTVDSVGLLKGTGKYS